MPILYQVEGESPQDIIVCAKNCSLPSDEELIMAPHVCIVGAGVSGLRCAAVLLDHHYEVTIIEARNRIGGRVGDCKTS